jgi:hypothetical protein
VLTLGALLLALLLWSATRAAQPRPGRVVASPVTCRQSEPRDRGLDLFLAAVERSAEAEARALASAAGGSAGPAGVTDVVEILGSARLRGPDGRERLLVTVVRRSGEGEVPFLLEVSPGSEASGGAALIRSARPVSH